MSAYQYRPADQIAILKQQVKQLKVELEVARRPELNTCVCGHPIHWHWNNQGCCDNQYCHCTEYIPNREVKK